MSVTMDAATVDSRMRVDAIGQDSGAHGHFRPTRNRTFCTGRVHTHQGVTVMKKSMNVLLAGLTFALALSVPFSAWAQEAQPTAPAPPEGGLYLTAFRSPATGLEYRAGRFAIHAGYYVTILKSGEQ